MQLPAMPMLPPLLARFAVCGLLLVSAGVRAATPPPPDAAAQAAEKLRQDEADRARAGLPSRDFRRLFRAYEPMEAGYTVDHVDGGRDDKFLDATISFMFPAFHATDVPDVRDNGGRREGFWRGWNYRRPLLYFAMTDRFGQFVYTRESSPVINKRFNPVFALRWWSERDAVAGQPAPQALESQDNFFEVVYAHESNGQSVDSERQYDAQVNAYFEENSGLNFEEQLRRAHRSARDNISRGWDYWGVQFARDWDPQFGNGTLSFRARANFYVGGVFQQHMEQYNPWEVDPDHPSVSLGDEQRERSDYDGLSFRVAYVSRADRRANDGFDGRAALTWTTGYDRPIRHNTLKLELGFRFKTVPLLFWVRTGYNSDLVDYFRRDTSFGAKLSFWRF